VIVSPALDPHIRDEVQLPTVIPALSSLTFALLGIVLAAVRLVVLRGQRSAMRS
jgi:hypothetical protein